MNGKLIVIEGLDGAGKGTQSRLLYDNLAAKGKKVLKVSFPDYESDSSALVRMYLAGQFGTQPDDVNAYAASTFFAVDRFAGFKQKWGSFYLDGGIIIADRYTTSNAIHQCSKLPEAQWESYIEWLFELEYDRMGIPAPDCVIYLQTDPAISRRMLSKRYGGDEGKKDIHEKNSEYMDRSRKAAEYCAERLGWNTVCCVEGDGYRSIEDIQNEIAALLAPVIGE